MQIIDPSIAATDLTLDAPIIARTVDEVVHFVLAPGERVKTFCFAQRQVHGADFRFIAVVLAERQLLLIRPTDDSRYALESAEEIDRCSLVNSKRRPDNSSLIAIHTPSGLLRLFVDSSWSHQAAVIMQAFTEPAITAPAVAEPAAAQTPERAGVDGFASFDDTYELSQQFAGLVDDEEDDPDW